MSTGQGGFLAAPPPKIYKYKKIRVSVPPPTHTAYITATDTDIICSYLKLQKIEIPGCLTILISNCDS